MTASEPSINELKSYAKSLPPLYEQIMLAFRYASTDRKYGGALLDYTIIDYVKRQLVGTSIWREPPPTHALPPGAEAWLGVSDVQVREGLTQLTVSKFLERIELKSSSTSMSFPQPGLSSGPQAYAPTRLGESLLEALTGAVTPAALVPPLPKPSWL